MNTQEDEQTSKRNKLLEEIPKVKNFMEILACQYDVAVANIPAEKDGEISSQEISILPKALIAQEAYEMFYQITDSVIENHLESNNPETTINEQRVEDIFCHFNYGLSLKRVAIRQGRKIADKKLTLEIDIMCTTLDELIKSVNEYCDAP